MTERLNLRRVLVRERGRAADDGIGTEWVHDGAPWRRPEYATPHRRASVRLDDHALSRANDGASGHVTALHPVVHVVDPIQALVLDWNRQQPPALREREHFAQ